MACNIFRSKPQTLRQLKAVLGYSSDYPDYVTDPKLGARNIQRRKAEWDRKHDEMPEKDPSPLFLCGNIKVEMCLGGNGCMYPGDVLCDWPMGKGKTCDLPLCDDHSRSIGEDRDLCPIHFGLWQRAR